MDSFAGAKIPKVQTRRPTPQPTPTTLTEASIGTHTNPTKPPGVPDRNDALPSVPKKGRKKKPQPRDRGVSRDSMDQMLVARLLTMASHAYVTPRIGQQQEGDG